MAEEVIEVQRAVRVPVDVGEQLRMLAAVTGVDEEEHLRRAVLGYLETSGRGAETTALVERARERLHGVLARLGDL